MDSTDTITLEDLNWPCDLSPELKQAFVDSARRLQFDSGFELLNTGGDGYSINYIIRGTVSAQIIDARFTSQSLMIFQHEWYGQNMVFEKHLKGQFQFNFIQPTEMLRWSPSILNQLTESTPEVYKLLYFIQKSRFFDLVQNMAVNPNFDIETRVTFALVNIASRSSRIRGALPTIYATQSQIADVCGISRQQVNPVLQSFVAAEIIEVKRGKIHILIPKALQSRLDAADLPIQYPSIV